MVGDKTKAEECSDDKDPKWECPPIKNVTHPLRYYEFSPEEIKALEECDKESFYQRCLPFSTLLGTLTYLGVKNGHLKPNPRFGAIPKVTLAVIVGYFIGKLSYQQACAEKLMALPNSYIGHLLKEKKEGRSGTYPTSRTPTMYGVTSEDVYSDAGPGNSLDLDTDRPLFNDDSFRPGSDTGPLPTSPDVAPSRPTLSYEELRRKNRGEYTEARQDPYKVESNPVPPISRPKQQPQTTNKYGDVME